MRSAMIGLVAVLFSLLGSGCGVDAGATALQRFVGTWEHSGTMTFPGQPPVPLTWTSVCESLGDEGGVVCEPEARDNLLVLHWDSSTQSVTERFLLSAEESHVEHVSGQWDAAYQVLTHKGTVTATDGTVVALSGERRFVSDDHYTSVYRREVGDKLQVTFEVDNRRRSAKGSEAGKTSTATTSPVADSDLVDALSGRWNYVGSESEKIVFRLTDGKVGFTQQGEFSEFSAKVVAATDDSLTLAVSPPPGVADPPGRLLVRRIDESTIVINPPDKPQEKPRMFTR